MKTKGTERGRDKIHRMNLQTLSVKVFVRLGGFSRRLSAVTFATVSSHDVTSSSRKSRITAEVQAAAEITEVLTKEIRRLLVHSVLIPVERD